MTIKDDRHAARSATFASAILVPRDARHDGRHPWVGWQLPGSSPSSIATCMPKAPSHGPLSQALLSCAFSASAARLSRVPPTASSGKSLSPRCGRISRRVFCAHPIATLEAYRTHRLMATLTNDVDTVSAFTFNFSGYAIAFAVTLGSFVYLLILSRPVFLISLGSVVIGVMINIIAKQGWIRDYEKVRVAQDDLHKQYRAIIDGAKELKISRPRRVNIYGVQLAGAADKIATLKSRAMQLFWLADACGSAIFFCGDRITAYRSTLARHQCECDKRGGDRTALRQRSDRAARGGAAYFRSGASLLSARRRTLC